MSHRKKIMALAAGTFLAGSAFTGLASPASASSNESQTPLANVLLADGDKFDRNGRDYDIVTQAALAVLEAKPDSSVSVLTKGDVALTAFIPNDRAFRHLVQDISGEHIRDEEQVFNAVAGLGIDTVETVLLYHVVPGATIDSETAVDSDGTALKTAQGGEVTVDVRKCGDVVRLIDADTDDRDPKVVEFDLNDGNAQIAHGINQVLRPTNL